MTVDPQKKIKKKNWSASFDMVARVKKHSEYTSSNEGSSSVKCKNTILTYYSLQMMETATGFCP